MIKPSKLQHEGTNTPRKLIVRRERERLGARTKCVGE